MAILTMTDVQGIAQRGRPWTFRMECGTSYWYATGRGPGEALEVGVGVRGAAPQLSISTWAQMSQDVQTMLGQGWHFAATPFIRMSPQGLAQVTGGIPQVPHTAVSVSPAAPPPPPPPPPPSTGVVVELKMRRQGLTVQGYDALDSQGTVLMSFNPADGVDYARLHNLTVTF